MNEGARQQGSKGAGKPGRKFTEHDQLVHKLAAEIRRQRELRAADMDVRRANAFLAQLAEWKRQWEAERERANGLAG